MKMVVLCPFLGNAQNIALKSNGRWGRCDGIIKKMENDYEDNRAYYGRWKR